MRWLLTQAARWLVHSAHLRAMGCALRACNRRGYIIVGSPPAAVTHRPPVGLAMLAEFFFFLSLPLYLILMPQRTTLPTRHHPIFYLVNLIPNLSPWLWYHLLEIETPISDLPNHYEITILRTRDRKHNKYKKNARNYVVQSTKLDLRQWE